MMSDVSGLRCGDMKGDAITFSLSVQRKKKFFYFFFLSSSFFFCFSSSLLLFFSSSLLLFFSSSLLSFFLSFFLSHLWLASCFFLSFSFFIFSFLFSFPSPLPSSPWLTSTHHTTLHHHHHHFIPFLHPICPPTLQPSNPPAPGCLFLKLKKISYFFNQNHFFFFSCVKKNFSPKKQISAHSLEFPFCVRSVFSFSIESILI